MMRAEHLRVHLRECLREPLSAYWRLIKILVPSAFLASTLLCSTATAKQPSPPKTPPPTPTAPTDPTTQAMTDAQSRAVATQQDIERYLQDTSNVKWLKSTQDESFLMLYRADQSGKSLGLALLLHGEQQHPAAGPILETLRTQLPDHGWATLSIGFLHDSDLMRFFENNKAQKNDKTGVTSTTAPTPATPPAAPTPPTDITVPAFAELSKIGKNFQERLTTTLPVIAEKAPMHITVIAFDISALWFFESLKAGISLPGLSSVILIDGYQPVDYKNFDLIQSTINSGFSLMDLAVAHPEAIVQSQLRRIRARQKQRKNYRYLKINHTLSTPANKTQLTRRISGWLGRQIPTK